MPTHKSLLFNRNGEQWGYCTTKQNGDSTRKHCDFDLYDLNSFYTMMQPMNMGIYNHQRGWHMGGVQKNGDKLCYIPTSRVKHV